jgi:hypothetical protein
MTREIELVFPTEGAVLRIELLDAAAPKTSQAVWDALPISGPAGHGNYSGTVVGVLMDASIVVPKENATAYIQTGDVMYTHYNANERHGYPDALSEIYVAYDRYARPITPGEGIPATANIFGRVIGDPMAFYAVCRRLPTEGAKPLEVRRAGT